MQKFSECIIFTYFCTFLFISLSALYSLTVLFHIVSTFLFSYEIGIYHKSYLYAHQVIGEDNSPEPTRYEKDDTNECIRDIVLNVRVQRPYHKKTHMKKACKYV